MRFFTQKTCCSTRTGSSAETVRIPCHDIELSFLFPPFRGAARVPEPVPLVKSTDDIHVLDRLPGCPFSKVVDGETTLTGLPRFLP